MTLPCQDCLGAGGTHLQTVVLTTDNRPSLTPRCQLLPFDLDQPPADSGPYAESRTRGGAQYIIEVDEMLFMEAKKRKYRFAITDYIVTDCNTVGLDNHFRIIYRKHDELRYIQRKLGASNHMESK